MDAPAEISIDLIVSAAAAQAGLRLSDVLATPGTPQVAGADQVRRRVVLIATRLQPGLSHYTLGKALGGREVDGVRSALIAAERRLDTDPAEPAVINDILASLGVSALPGRPAKPWRPAQIGEHVCSTCEAAAVFGEGRTWYCVRCVPAGFLPHQRRTA